MDATTVPIVPPAGHEGGGGTTTAGFTKNGMAISESMTMSRSHAPCPDAQGIVRGTLEFGSAYDALLHLSAEDLRQDRIVRRITAGAREYDKWRLAPAGRGRRIRVMASWRQLEEEAPELAARARAFLEARKHKTIATLRKDGSPRISGTEADLVDGELMWGSMWRAMKALDLLRDPRFALHSGSDDPPGWSGDVKVSGRAEELDDDDRKRALIAAQGNQAGDSLHPFHLFRGDLDEVVVTRLSDARDKLVIELWRPGEGVRTTER